MFESNKNKNLLVSIITPNYNGDKFLEECIKSVINQSSKDYEYIIIDGGSTDESKNIIKKYEKFIKYFVSEKDNGLYDAIDKGIKKANGEKCPMCWKINLEKCYRKSCHKQTK